MDKAELDHNAKCAESDVAELLKNLEPKPRSVAAQAVADRMAVLLLRRRVDQLEATIRHDRLTGLREAQKTCELRARLERRRAVSDATQAIADYFAKRIADLEAEAGK